MVFDILFLYQMELIWEHSDCRYRFYSLDLSFNTSSFFQCVDLEKPIIVFACTLETQSFGLACVTIPIRGPETKMKPTPFIHLLIKANYYHSYKCKTAKQLRTQKPMTASGSLAIVTKALVYFIIK